LSELLEGVLSETMLNQIAEDLGVEADALRKHPFFRVLKGRVILTYPLRVPGGMPTFQPTGYEQFVDPTQNVYKVILDQEGAGELYALYMMTDDAVTAIIRTIRLTIDGQTPIIASSTSQAEIDPWYFVHLDSQLLKTAPIAHLGLKFSTSLKLEIRTNNTLVAGKYIRGVAWWGLVE